jgi:hypothetical protein
MFAWRPNMTTALAISGNTPFGNFTTVTQYAGYTLWDLMNDPGWWQLTLVRRAVVARRVAGCLCMTLADMHAAVSGGWCCFLAAAVRGVSVHMCMILVHVAVITCMKAPALSAWRWLTCMQR